MQSKIRKDAYVYVGQYKSPLLYHWLCQQWVNNIVAKENKLPVLDGRLLLLDGHWFFYKKDWETVKQYTKKAVGEKNKRFFSAVLKIAEKEIQRMLSVSERVVESNKISPSLLKEFFDTLHDMEFPWSFMIPMGEVLEEVVKKKLSSLNLPKDYIQVFFTLGKPTLLIQQRKEVIEIRKRLEQEKILEQIQDFPTQKIITLIKQKNSTLYKNVEKHIQEFKWFGMMHLWGTPFTEEKFFEQLKATKEIDIKRPKEIKLNAELSWIRQQTIELSYWRQHIAEVCAIASYKVLKVLKTASSKMGLEYYNQACWLSPQEFLDGIKGKSLPLSEVLEKRKRGFGLVVENNEIVILTEKELQDILNLLFEKTADIKEIKGMAAYQGKVKGIVQIVLSPNEIARVKDGEIIVAPETTPDFLPILHKVKAIITDIGGITSHAAIFSRELGIPCVVGTKIATKVLKDEDLVEVDASQGVITILKRK